ncbi:MAG: TRAP transporter small permease subunit [Bacillota bacterium]|jgi:TRAP-type C4-dicarboxylate transport system permease small subunit|nr:TRAP transporter small permease subunit [Bacillota bacterium]
MKKIEEFFVWRLIIKLVRIILILCSASAILFIVISVLTRYVFKVSMFGVEEIILLIAMWLYFIGGVYGSYKDNHITADVLSTYVKSEKIKRALRIFVTGLCLVISIILAVWGIIYINWSFQVGGATVGLQIPMIFLRMPLFIGFIMMCLFNLYHFVNVIINRQIPGGDAA